MTELIIENFKGGNMMINIDELRKIEADILKGLNENIDELLKKMDIYREFFNSINLPNFKKTNKDLINLKDNIKNRITKLQK
jgi:hypothetical protein